MDRLARLMLRAPSQSPAMGRDGFTDSLGDSLWLGGEAMIAPGYVSDLRALQRGSDEDCVDATWLTI